MSEISQINRWLPRDALGQGSIEPILVRLLREWSDRWIVDARVSAIPIYQDDWPPNAQKVKWRSSAAIATIALTESTQWSLAAALLGSPAAQGSLQPTDRRIIDNLVTVIVDDLLRLLEREVDDGTRALMDTPIDFNGCQWWQVTLGPSKRSFNLAIATPALVKILKRDLPVCAKRPMGTVAKGLARQPVEIGVQLGGCSVTLNDIEGLGPGDVLVLDRLTEDPMDVLINGSRTPFRCMIDEFEGRASLKLTSKDSAHA
jgi:hypothetical protein